MKNIKYRAWFNEQPEWCNQMFYSDEEGTIGDWFSECEIEMNEGKGGIFMQFTGLHDRNGKEIYSGDILDLHSTVNGVNLFEVYYNEQQARFSIKYYTSRMPKRSLEYEYSVSSFFKPCEFSGEVDFEVVGNIYQNSELLE